MGSAATSSMSSCAKMLLLWLQTALLMSMAFGYQSVFFDKYAHCNRDKPFELADEVYTLYPVGGGLAHENMMCRIIFKSPPGLGVCLTFRKFRIQDCGVKMIIESSDTSPDPDVHWRTLSCADSSPNQMCTSSRYVALKLTKKQLNGNIGYEFNISVEGSSQTSEEGILFASIGVVIGVIVGVLALIVIIAMLVFYCKRSQPQTQGQELQKPVVEPTAPPADELEEARQPLQPQISYEATHPKYPPPPYTPYGEGDAPSQETEAS